MPFYRIRKTVDATAIYEADVEATTREEAVSLARLDYRRGYDKFDWVETDGVEYDDAAFEPV